MKQYKAEMWDKMQKIMERYNDHMTHTYLEFDTMLDFDTLKRAFANAMEKAPILKSRYKENFFRACWEEMNIDINKIVKFTETDDPKTVSEKFLCGKIDEKNEPQIKALLVRSHGKDTLNILKNHMVMDGGSIKLFLDFLSEIYSDLSFGGNGDIPFENGCRGEEQIYHDFSNEERQKLEKLVSYSKKQKDKISFPYQTKNKKELTPFIERQKADKTLFKAAKQKCKALSCTLNDLIVASYYRAVYSTMDISKEKALGVPCMIDLRKYINSPVQSLTNLTSMIVCHIGNDIGNDIFETVKKVKESMDSLKQNYPGLHGIPLLRGVFRYTPYALAKFLIGTFFKNPLMGISNIGILKAENLSFAGVSPVYAYLTGSIKYPPYIQLALTTYNDEITFSVASYGTQQDRNLIKLLLRNCVKEMQIFANQGAEKPL